MGNELLRFIATVGIEHLPMITVCACLWVLVRKKPPSENSDQ